VAIVICTIVATVSIIVPPRVLNITTSYVIKGRFFSALS
jgi:hypothetical protein